MKVVVTAIGSMAADVVIRSLRANRNVSAIVGTDTNPSKRVPLSALVDEFRRMPLAPGVDFIEHLHKIVDDLKVDVIIPLTDPEVDAIVDMISSGIWPKRCMACVSPPAVVRICRDKLALHDFLRYSSDLVTVPSWLLDGDWRTSLRGPLVAKPRRGRSSEGLIYASSPAEIDALVGTQVGHDYVVQPFVPGDVYTVDVIRSPDGIIVSAARREIVRSSRGAGLVVESCTDRELLIGASQAAETLGVIGAVNFEFIRGADSYQLIDANPRPSAGIGFSELAGLDVARLHLASFTGGVFHAEPVGSPGQMIMSGTARIVV